MRLWIQINSILGFNQFNTITIKWIKLSPKLWMNLTQIRCSGLSMPFWTKIKNSNSLNYAKIEIQLIMYISCVSDGGMKWPDVGFITGSGKWSSRRLPTHRVPHLNFPDCAIGEKTPGLKGHLVCVAQNAVKVSDVIASPTASDPMSFVLSDGGACKNSTSGTFF